MKMSLLLSLSNKTLRNNKNKPVTKINSKDLREWTLERSSISVMSYKRGKMVDLKKSKFKENLKMLLIKSCKNSLK